MTVRHKIAAAFTLGIFVLLTAVSCSTGISQEDYDQVKAALNDTKQELQNVTQELSETITEYAASLKEEEGIPATEAELRDQFTELRAQYEAGLDELDKLKTEYDNLRAQISSLSEDYDSKVDEMNALRQDFQELESLYAAATTPPGPIDTARVEQLIFDMVNEARADAGLTLLAPGQYIQDTAEENSRWMAENADTRYVDGTSWQDIFRATGHTTAEEVADAALKLWKSNILTYQQNVLPAGAKWGAVSAVRNGDVIYITYLASIFE